MCTFQEIQKANESIKTMGITRKQKDKTTGQYVEVTKEYAEVNQRVKAFRMVHPNGSITCEIKSIDEKEVVIQAFVYDKDSHLLGAGLAHESKNASQINQTSFIENCETSAVGRALGFCGFGIDTSIASLEEVKQAIAQQEENKNFTEPKKEIIDTGEPITENQLKVLHNLPIEVIANITEHYKVGSLEEMTKAQGIETISKLRNKTNGK